MSNSDEAARIVREWREKPCRFVYDNFKVTPDRWQEQALKDFADPAVQRISLQACAGPGKSAALAWMGLNFLSCYGEPGEHPKGAAVSVTADNLKDNLWPEFSKWQERSDYLKKTLIWTKERISSRDHPNTWFISARSWSKKANAEEQGRTLSGLHSMFVLALVDEAGEIPLSVIKAGEQALSNCRWGKIVMAGNPTSHDGVLYQAATTLAHLWRIIRITGDPEDSNRSPRIGLDWAKEQIKTYGRDNPWVMAYILGQFPPSSINSLLSPDEVMAAMARVLRPDVYDFQQKRLGVDVARFGNDRTFIAPRQGLQWFRGATMRNARTHEIAARVQVAKDKFRSELEFVDDTGGWGAGVIDALILAHQNPIPVNFSSKASSSRYFNKRSEIHWLAAEAVKNGASLPNSSTLQRELTAPMYWFEGGKIRVEEKDQIKERLGFSPDEADAYAMTFALPDMPASPYAGSPEALAAAARRTGENVENRTKDGGDWDPFKDTAI